jgi:hypothetical protein
LRKKSQEDKDFENKVAERKMSRKRKTKNSRYLSLTDKKKAEFLAATMPKRYFGEMMVF